MFGQSFGHVFGMFWEVFGGCFESVLGGVLKVFF